MASVDLNLTQFEADTLRKLLEALEHFEPDYLLAHHATPAVRDELEPLDRVLANGARADLERIHEKLGRPTRRAGGR